MKNKKSCQHRCIPIKLPIESLNRNSHYVLIWFRPNTKGILRPYHYNTDEKGARRFCKKWGLKFSKTQSALPKIGTDMM